MGLSGEAPLCDGTVVVDAIVIGAGVAGLAARLRTTVEERQLAADSLEGFNAARLDRASMKAIARQSGACGTVHGALETGVRAAREILRR
jgi:monoamine oxidase